MEEKLTNIYVGERKGGVGKTTFNVTLGVSLAALGHKTLIVDADPQGNVGDATGLESTNATYRLMDIDGAANDLFSATAQSENLFVVTGGKRSELIGDMHKSDGLSFSDVESHLSDHLSGFDFVLWDSGPSGYLQELCMYLADYAILPFELEYLSVLALHKTVSAAKKIWADKGTEPLYTVIPVRVAGISDRTLMTTALMPNPEARATSNMRQFFADVLEAYGTAHVSGIYIPERVDVRHAMDAGLTIVQYNPDNLAAHAYTKIAACLLQLDAGVAHERITNQG